MQSAEDLQGPLPTVPGLLRLIHRLEQAWRELPPGRPPPHLSAFLPPPTDPLRPPALRELIRLDLEMRWRRGLPVVLEAYLQQFPELGVAGTLTTELIYHEYRVRQQFGDRPNLASYRDRFPTQYQRLLALVQARQDSSPATIETNHSSRHQATPDPDGGDAPAVSEVDTSSLRLDTLPPLPASGKKTGDILIPPDVEVGAGGDPAVVPMVGGYRLLQRLNSGALGEVWKAEAPGGIEVAVKRLSRTLDADEAQYELHSLEHIKRLRHRFLAQIHAYWIHKNRLFIVMELADSSLLDRAESCRAQGQPGIPHDELLRSLRESAEALDFLHAQGVHHRDIKPANILLLGGHVKVADFGLARPLKGDQSVVNATFCGTPGYMAPEVWENKFSTHSDQWSLAVTYLELRLNRRLFKSRDVASLMQEIRRGRYNLSPLGKAEKAVLLRALHPNPRHRYPNCTAFAAALESVFQPPAATAPRRLQSVTTFLIGLVAMVLLAGIIIWIVVPPRPARVQLTTPSQLFVDSGRPITFRVDVLRDNYNGPIALSADGADVDAVVPAGEGSVEVSLGPNQTARPGRRHIHLWTTDAALAGQAGFELTVRYLPLGFEVVDPQTTEDSRGVSYYQRIRRRLSDTESIEFVLIPQLEQDGMPDQPTFYIGSNKVSQGQFRAFAEQNPKRVASEEWRNWKDDRLPALGLSVLDAHAFAREIGGYLPHRDQWDKATGWKHPLREEECCLEGPYRGSWRDTGQRRIAVGGRSGPVALDAPEEEDDESSYGVRGMAGNGTEWTRLTLSSKEVPLPRSAALRNERVIYRGRSFVAFGPLRFEQLVGEETAVHDEVAPDRGFRVVLEPNR